MSRKKSRQITRHCEAFIILELVIYYFARKKFIGSGFPSLKEILINIAATLAVYLMLFLIKYLIGRKRLAGASMKQIDKMTGEEFEQFLGILYKKKGYKVKFTPGTKDFGADLIIERDGIRGVIQAKRYTNSVGEAAVQQAISGMQYYGADKCAVVTNSQFTNAAMELADRCTVKLINRNMLYKGKIDI